MQSKNNNHVDTWIFDWRKVSNLDDNDVFKVARSIEDIECEKIVNTDNEEVCGVNTNDITNRTTNEVTSNNNNQKIIRRQTIITPMMMTKKIKALALKVETSQNQNLPPLTTRI